MLELTKDTFEEEVLKEEGYTLVDYWSDGCEPCKALMPSIVELSEKYESKVKFCKLNTTKARRLAISQRVMGLPAIVLYKGGEKIDERTKEEATKKNIDEMIEKNI
ncbi:MAG: thioredoxin domain-containing protein [Bacillota bacterium]|nr:thioredoxin domain-containing protein [Bacillota bacterium]